MNYHFLCTISVNTSFNHINIIFSSISIISVFEEIALDVIKLFIVVHIFIS